MHVLDLFHMKKLLTTVLALFIVGIAFQKADGSSPVYSSMYLYELQRYNPAYAGVWYNIGITASGQQQRLQKSIGASTYDLAIHSGILDKNMGLGFNLNGYNYGSYNHLSASVDYSYGFKIKSTIIRIGMRGSYSNSVSNAINLGDNDDVASFYEGSNYLGLGGGVLLSVQRFYAGLAVPQLFFGVDETDSRYTPSSIAVMDLGYFYSVNNILEIVPSSQVVYDFKNKSTINLGAAFLFYHKLWLGGKFTILPIGTVEANIRFSVNNRLMVGYGFESYGDGISAAYRYNSHQLMISYILPYKRRRLHSPRYF